MNLGLTPAPGEPQLDTPSQLSAVLFVMTHYPLFAFLQPVCNPHDSTLAQDIIRYFSDKILWATVSNAMLHPRYIVLSATAEIHS